MGVAERVRTSTSFEELLEFFLVHDSEPLLFVDHDKSKVLENNIAGNDAVRSDDDVDSAFPQKLQDFALLGRRTEPTEHFDAHRIIQHALPEGVEVLLGQDGGGRKDRHLFAFHDGFKGGPDRDLGLAKTNIPADEPIHGAGALHVDFRIGDRL